MSSRLKNACLCRHNKLVSPTMGINPTFPNENEKGLSVVTMESCMFPRGPAVMLSVIVSCVRFRHAVCILDRRRVSERHFRRSKQWKQLHQALSVVPMRKATANRQVFVQKTLNHCFLRRFDHDNNQTTSQTQAMEGALEGVLQLLHLMSLEGREGTHG